ncbi:MAG: diguanylate cyclase [Sulfurimonas sp.]|jgi:diguanylate cyclase (GGDEF)-like protein|nr:diguanylate cyclase [Sulfurimonas sp.]
MKSRSLYQSLSIFKKFLLAPVLGLFFVIPVAFYLLLTTKEVQEDVYYVNQEMFPLYELTRDNVILLERISHEISSAVAAKEKLWLEDAFVHAQLMKKNMREYRDSSFAKAGAELATEFDLYFEHVIELSKNIIKSDGYYDGIEQDTRLSVEYYLKLDFLLKDLQKSIKEEIQVHISSVDTNTSFLLFKGALLFIAWFIGTIIITLLVYRDIKKRIGQIVEASKNIARGEADFKDRLELPMQDELGEIVDSINTFISNLDQSHKELLQTKEELQLLYVRDKLTGLHNRVKIDEVIENEINRFERYNIPFSIILADIDHFKKLNDSFGHLLGDEILQEFAQKLQENIRNTDFVARWGGEEFLIVCPQVDEAEASIIAEKLRKKIEENSFGGHALSASFGVACYEMKQSQDQLLHNADVALYEAKKRGRNQVVRFDSL